MVVQKYKNELMIINKKYELLQRDHQQLKRALGKMENDLEGMKHKVKTHTTDHKSSKEDYKQSLNKMKQKVAQISHEMRKSGADFSKLQELYRKNAKDNLPYKNGFDTTSKISSEGTEILYKHLETCNIPSIHELTFMLKEGYERTQKQLIEENQQLKECLKLLQDEITSSLNQAVEKLKEKLPKEDIKNLESIYLKPMIFQTSITGILNDVYQIIRENIYRIQFTLLNIISLCS